MTSRINLYETTPVSDSENALPYRPTERKSETLRFICVSLVFHAYRIRELKFRLKLSTLTAEAYCVIGSFSATR